MSRGIVASNRGRSQTPGASSNRDSLELQLRRLAKLEGECSQRAAAEAREKELVEQMRNKVRQFERQNVENVENADEEMARLSDDLGRSLQAHRALEARALQGERRVEELRRGVEELAADCAAEAARRRGHIDEVRRLQFAATEERAACAAAAAQLRGTEEASSRLSREIANSSAARLGLEDELQHLGPHVARRRGFDRAAEAAAEQAWARAASRAFRRFAAGVRAAQRQRPRVEIFRRNVRLGFITLALGRWVQFCRLCRQQRCWTLPHEAPVLASSFRSWARWGALRSNSGRWLRRRAMLCWSQAAQCCALARKDRYLRSLCTRLILRWRGLVIGSSQLLHLDTFAWRLRRRRVLLVFVDIWRRGSVELHGQEAGCNGLTQRRELAYLRASFRVLCMYSACRRHLAATLVLARGLTIARIARAVLQAFQQNWLYQLRFRAIASDVASHHVALQRKRLQRKAFDAFWILVNQRRRLRTLTLQARHGRCTELFSTVVPAWRDATLWQQRSSDSLTRPLSRRRRACVRHWSSWAHAQRRTRTFSNSCFGFRLRRSARTASSCFGQWARHVTSRHVHATREHEVAARQRLSLGRRALRAWDAAARRSIMEGCERLGSALDCAAEAQAAGAERLEHLERGQRQEALARLELASEARRRMKEAAELGETIAGAKRQTAGVLASLEREQAVAAGLRSQLAELKAARCRPRVPGVQVQLEEALEVQGSLRFALRQTGAEAERLAEARARAEALAQELRGRVSDAGNSYVQAVDALDQKRSTLAKEGREAQQACRSMEKALESATFRVRMRDLEMQRWRSHTHERMHG